MIRVNVREAKAHFSHYLDLVEHWETILLCRRNVPVAEICPVAKEHKRHRPLGLGKGLVRIPPSFFDPLPDEELDFWEGL